MKRSKQWIGGALALCVALSLTACTEKPLQPEDTPTTTATTTNTTAAPTPDEAIAVYNAAVAKTAALSDMHCEVKLVYDVQSDSSSVSSSDTTLIYRTTVDGNPAGKIEARSASVGQASTNTMYIQNGIAYTEADGEKFSYTLSEEDLKNTLEPESIVLSSSMLSDVSLTEADGKRTFSATVRAADVPAFVGGEDGMDSLFGALGEGTFGDGALKTVINKDGYTESEELDVTATLTAENGTVTTFRLMMSYTYIDLGQPVEIAWPDFAEYPSMDEQMEAQQLVMEVIQALFDESGNMAANFEAQYNALCATYGQEAIDAVLQALAEQT